MNGRIAVLSLALAGALGVGPAQAGFLDFIFAPQAPQPVAPSPSMAAPVMRLAPRHVPVRQAKARVLTVTAKSKGPICCKDGQDPMVALMLDPTLRRGDVVMTQAGLRVFDGPQGERHQSADFAALNTMRKLDPRDAKELNAINGLSRAQTASEEIVVAPAAPASGTLASAKASSAL